MQTQFVFVCCKENTLTDNSLNLGHIQTLEFFSFLLVVLRSFAFFSFYPYGSIGVGR
jgi:hypothetical protein